MKLTYPIIILVSLSACTPASAPPGPTPIAEQIQSQPTLAACQRMGGTLKPVGRMQSLQCIVAYKDAGKSCSSGGQCTGDCLAPSDADVSPGKQTAGFCQASTERFGCLTSVENGRASSTICID